ncbi:J domain-containing protein [Saccharicrinis sp. FJH2]|uniref:J domain-containing protein n=1 Tax=Saccharicrinis sp. FJH65 TaxID=3344659 RepID=UPI0035F4F19E
MENVKEIFSSNFLDSITSVDLFVLRAKTGNELDFNKILQLQFEQHYSDRISLGWINISEINYNEKIITEFVKSWIPDIGLQKTESVMPGYYLFKNGKLIAYHPGTIDLSKINQQVHGLSAIFSVIAGLVVGLVEKDFLKGVEAFLNTLEAPQAFKVFEFFKEALGDAQSSSKQRQQSVFNEELDRAYKILGVSPDNTDEEIKKAWKKLQLKYHPDKSIENKDERTKIIAEINNAYDLVKKSRIRD